MGDIAALLPILSGATSAVSQYEEGQSTKMAANINAGYANMQAQDATRIGEVEAGRRLQQGAQDASSAEARAAAQGINASTGSAAKTQEDIRAAAQVDAATIQKNAAMQAWGFGVEAANFRSQGRFAQIKGYTQGAQSLISGGLQAANMYSAMNPPKPVTPLYVAAPGGKTMSDPRNR